MQKDVYEIRGQRILESQAEEPLLHTAQDVNI